MEGEPSAKRPAMEDESSAKRPHGEKLDYTTKLNNVQVHGKEPLHVVCISNPTEADKMIRKLRKRVDGLFERIVGVDVEFTKNEDPDRAAILQLCMEDQCLVYHITAAKQKPKDLDAFLMDGLYTFVGFSIEGDKQMLKNSDLVINLDKYIDMQHGWRDPYSGKDYDSLADVASMVIHPFYMDMKKKINRQEDHDLWGISPPPERLIKYAATDAYATYESWKKIITISKGRDREKEEKESFGNPYARYDF